MNLVSCLPTSEGSVSLVRHSNILSETSSIRMPWACDSISGHSLFPITGALTFYCQQYQGVKGHLAQARAAIPLTLKPPLGCLHSCIASFLVVSVHRSLKRHTPTSIASGARGPLRHPSSQSDRMCVEFLLKNWLRSL